VKRILKISTPTDCEIVLERVFEAPRGLVWQAMTRADLLIRWMLGPESWEMTVCDNDLRASGTFHIAWSGPGGAAMSLRGVYRDVVPPERYVRTESFQYAGAGPQVDSVNTLVLKEQAGKTHLMLTVLFPSKEARDAVAPGMQYGIGAAYDRLEEVVAEMIAPAVPADPAS
jgi:uncharacterized protein YndB with AHSA1/START domain